MLLPILNAKSDYIHAEGICQAVYGLAEAEIHDAETWGKLQAAIKEHHFEYQVVKNFEMNPTYFRKVGKNEMGAELCTELSTTLFFHDGINAVELYSGLVNAADKVQGLDKTLSEL